MKQLNNNTLKDSINDREPNICFFCDTNDRCDVCDAKDFGDWDCGTCDLGAECTIAG